MIVFKRQLLLQLTAIVLFISISIIGCGGSPESDEAPTVMESVTDHRLLVFSYTDGWRHDSIEAGVEAIELLGEENGVSVYATEDSGHFTEYDLSNYDAIIFLNTTEAIFNEEQRDAFRSYIQNGGGFVGVHSASDTEYDWPWYGELVGAYFDSHPNNPNVRNARIEIVNSDHRSTDMLPNPWERDDEWYNFRQIPDHVEVLLQLDTESYEGSAHPGNHPIAWYHEFDGGRAFYTGLGHTIESYSEDLFLQHLWGGIEYSMGID